MRASKITRAIPVSPHLLAVVRDVTENLFGDAEILTDQTMDDVATSWRRMGIEYVPEKCVAIREAVRNSYVRGLLMERLIAELADSDVGLTEDVGDE